jgi:hypothetical protein
MPKRSAKTAGFPCWPEECFVSRHLEGPEYKILDLMRAAAPLTNGRRIFYASVRPWLCNAANQAASTVDATLLRLTEAGWLINLGRSRRADGTETPNSYEVVEHATWAAAHPGGCPDFKFAPNWDEANKYGVKKGERLKAAALPKNFWPDEPVLRSSLDKITAEKAALVTDEEMSALNAHFSSLTAMATGRPSSNVRNPQEGKKNYS